MNRNILVIHGPNLNMLGTREPGTYGSVNLDSINASIAEKCRQAGIEVDIFQSNHEGSIVDRIQTAVNACDGLIINPAAYTHTSIAIRDAVLMLDVPVIEIHLSNIFKRESFRHRSMLADVVTGQIAGLGAKGYLLAVDAMLDLIEKPQ